MRKPNSILPIHPAPEAADILSRESLSGYCIRLASNNHLNIEALLAELSAQGARLSHSTSKQRQFRNLDLSPQSLQPLATVSNQSIEQLFKLSATSLYETFYGQPNPGSTGVQLFFLLPYSQRSFVTIRRYCPLCLTERLLYPLLWQFSEITICTRHGCRLEERCPGCGHTIPLLRTGSVLGRCCHCLKQLTKSHPRWASTRDVEHQMGLNDDYELLLSGSIHFREGSQTPGSPMSWSTKLHYLRTHNDLSIKEVARHLHISPSTVLAIEKGNQLITFGILARMIRFYAGSFKKFSDVEVPQGWVPDTTRPSEFVCANPWCLQYRRTTFSVLGRTYFLCRYCSCRFPRREGTLLYGLPFNTFVDRLSRFVRMLDENLSPSTAYDLSELPRRRRSSLLRRLAACGIDSYSTGSRKLSKRSTPSPSTSWSPLFAFQTLGSRRLKKYVQLKNVIARATATLVGRGLPVTIPALAAMIKRSPQSLSYLLNHTPISSSLPPKSQKIRSWQFILHSNDVGAGVIHSPRLRPRTSSRGIAGKKEQT